MAKQIMLTKDKIATVDDEDYDFLMQWKWCAVQKGSGFYAQRKVKINNKQETIYMHRSIMNISEKNIIVDHKDHNTLNNQKENMRPCSVRENGANRIARKNCTSKYLGVCWKTSRKRW